MNALKPTKERINVLANLIALSAVMDEESIGDRFDFKGKNDEFLGKPYTEWLKKNYPDVFAKADRKFEINNDEYFDRITYCFWIQNWDGNERDLLDKYCEFVLIDGDRLEATLDECEKNFEDWVESMKEDEDDYDEEDFDETCTFDGRMRSSDLIWDSEKEVRDALNKLKKEAGSTSSLKANREANAKKVQTINSWVPEVQPGRKAKVMSKRDFIDMLIDDVYQYLCPEEQQWVEIYQDGGRPGPVIKKVSDNMYEQYPQPKFYEAFIAGLNDPKNKRFALIRKDVSKLADPITSFSEAYHLKKGLGTVHNGSIWFVGIGLWTDINVDGEAGRGSATAFAYYDGKDWRAFVPTRGNTINAKTKHIILYSHHSNKYKATEGIVRQEDYEYLKSHNYNLEMTGEINDPDTDLMLASLETRLIEA